MTGFEGWYAFGFPGGEFEVCLRPGGVLWCPEYMEQATWAVSGAAGAQEMAIDFKRYGTYMLKVSGKGMLEGVSTADANDWRKMKYTRELVPLELLLAGKGGGSFAPLGVKREQRVATGRGEMGLGRRSGGAFELDSVQLPSPRLPFLSLPPSLPFSLPRHHTHAANVATFRATRQATGRHGCSSTQGESLRSSSSTTGTTTLAARRTLR